MISTIFPPRYQYTDYQQWSDEWELIAGQPFSMLPSPKLRHGKVQSRASFEFQKSLYNDRVCNCLVLFEQDWKISEETVVRPDLMILCNEPEGDVVNAPPVLIMEVLSPGTRAKDRNIKFELYREQGVRYYLMADYERRILECFELRNNQYLEMLSTTFLLEEGCEITLDAAALWK